MKNRKNTKALKRIFEESETIEFSHQELDQNLKNMNIDPEELVNEGLERIEKLLGESDKKVIPIKDSTLNKFPIAAGKKNTSFENFKKEINKKSKKR